MTAGGQGRLDTNIPSRSIWLGVAVGIGAGLIFAGAARLTAEIVAPETIPIVPMLIAIALVVSLSIGLDRAARRKGVTPRQRKALPGYAACALTAVVGAALLPSGSAAVVAIGVGVVIRLAAEPVLRRLRPKA
jgi:hypothetical protein